MDSRTRVKNTIERRPVDRIPKYDAIWQDTLSGWREEGFPADINPGDFFDWDILTVGVDTSMRMEQKLISENAEYQVVRDRFGYTVNLLLNVGPTGRGQFDDRALDRLAGIGKWMKLHNRSIYGCTQAPEEFQAPQDCRLTYNPQTNRIYAHLFAWPSQFLALDGFAGKVEYAHLLNDASEVRSRPAQTHGKDFTLPGTDTLVLELPIRKPDVVVPVLELHMK